MKWIQTILAMATMFFGLGTARAHDVVWWENPTGFAPSNPMKFYYPDQFSGYVDVEPVLYEPCTVVVNLNPSGSSLISAVVLGPNPGVDVKIRVLILRPPSNHLETATLTGEWHATGLPPGNGCDAVNPNAFSVPITVSDQTPPWKFKPIGGVSWMNLDAGYNSGLQMSDCISGPWTGVGIGQMYKVYTGRDEGYFQHTTLLGGLTGGYLTDDANKPLTSVKIGLLYGGASGTSDSTGFFQLQRTAYGFNEFTITNPAIAGPSLNIGLSNLSNMIFNFKLKWAIGPMSNSHAPWVAMGYGDIYGGGRTPLFYAGGLYPPLMTSSQSNRARVMIMPPVGTSYHIREGWNSLESTKTAPASGLWGITATYGSQSQSATLNIPP